MEYSDLMNLKVIISGNVELRGECFHFLSKMIHILLEVVTFCSELLKIKLLKFIQGSFHILNNVSQTFKSLMVFPI